MTQQQVDERSPATTVGTDTVRRRPFWRRPWMIPLGVILAAFLMYTLPPYFTLDPAKARIAIREDVAWHYPFLLVHIVCGTVAQLTAFLQVWPWLRRKHRRVHRWSGRVYVFAGAVPSSVFCLMIVPFTPPVGRVGVAMAGVLWLIATVMGYVRARQRDYAAHRRWMLYGFAIVTGINFWGVAIIMLFLFSPLEFGLTYALEAARWFGWVINLFLVQWWLNRTARRPLVEANLVGSPR